SGDRERVVTIAYDDATLESFYRDIALQSPWGVARDDGTYSPMESQHAALYGRMPEHNAGAWNTIFPEDITYEDFVYMARNGETAKLNNGVKWHELQAYFRGDTLSDKKTALIEAVFPSRDFIIGPLRPVDPINFLAKDDRGRTPLDLGFG